ncbi:MAG: PEP-CTERM sorting domain-containing protein [Rhodanobacteraceae bacterium]
MNHANKQPAFDLQGNRHSFGLLSWALAITCLAIPHISLATSINGMTDNCTKGGTIIEHNFFGSAKHFFVHITNKEDGGNEVGQPIDAGVIPSGGNAVVHVPPPGPGIDHCDAFNSTEAVGMAGGGPGDVKPGAKQQLKIEALFVDPNTGQVILGSVFDFVSQAYPGELLVLPDLWGDTNGDGTIGGGDLLYSLVDLNAYTNGGADLLADVNARFVPGQEFEIANGVVAGLPGMLFSTTKFTFDPVNGYQGTPYTGSGFAVTDHEFASVPEPSTLTLFFVGLVVVALATGKRRRSPKELT